MKFALLLAGFLLAANCQAASLQDLVDRGDLRVRSWLTPAEDIVVGQEVQLTIEVSTQRWFAGGTRIETPEIPNLVILRRDQFANNLNQREGAVSWVMQRWNLQLYPKQAGQYTVPAIRLELSVNDAVDGVVRGTLDTSIPDFTAHVPAVLTATENWLATPNFEVSQTLDRELQELQPGDAITRTVVFKATQLASMMLPGLSMSSTPGLAAYPEVAKLTDRSNRGEALAERRESVVYVVEEAGQYTLPEQVFYWWNTSTQQAETAFLPALSLDAGAATAVAADPTPDSLTMTFTDLYNGRMLIALGLIISLAWLLRRQLKSASEAKLLARAQSALDRGDKNQVTQLLYQWLNLYGPRSSWYLLRDASALRSGKEDSEQLELLLSLAYGPVNSGTPRLKLKHWRKGSGLRSGPGSEMDKLLGNNDPLELNPGAQPRK